MQFEATARKSTGHQQQPQTANKNCILQFFTVTESVISDLFFAESSSTTVCCNYFLFFINDTSIL